MHAANYDRTLPLNTTYGVSNSKDYIIELKRSKEIESRATYNAVEHGFLSNNELSRHEAYSEV